MHPPNTSDAAPSRRWRVLKFGGTSIRDAGRMAAVAEIVAAARDRAEQLAVVVSAVSGATDTLVALALGPGSVREDGLDALRRRHLDLAAELADDDASAAVPALLDELAALLAELGDEEARPHLRDEILAFGERLSAPLVAAALRRRGLDARACDLRPLVHTDAEFGAAAVREEATEQALRRHFTAEPTIQVATGFVGSCDGRTTTLGRGGSDLTAALVGAALGAEEVEIWTDVDGVLSADPRVVPDAFSIASMSYEEVMELAHFGAKVLYPPSVAPARRAEVPLSIRNTLAPSRPGTRVTVRPEQQPLRSVTGISAVPDVVLLRLEGSGLLGVTGTAERFFGALARARCNVILISQASSEHSICCAIAPDRAEEGCRAVGEEFAEELRRGRIQPLVAETGMSVIAVVGEGMRERPGVAASVFSCLGGRNINVRAIAQGSSELNISMVVHAPDRERAVRALHGTLFVGARETVQESCLQVVVAGVGGVGSDLADMIVGDGDRLRLVGLLSSTHQLFADRIEAPHRRGSEGWRELLRARGEERDPADLVEVLREKGSACAFIDCTASPEVAEGYAELLRLGTPVIAANKISLAGDDLSLWRGGFSPAEPGLASEMAGRLRFEATVGAGLPVVSTLRSLIDGGDRVLEISGVFSGTLAYLTGNLRAGSPVSAAVREAYDMGYTEPDPRDDLSGTDVARKLLILARMCGAEVRLEDLEVEPLVPLEGISTIEEFWADLPAADEPLARRFAEAGPERSFAYLASAHFDESAVPGTPAAPLRVGLTELPVDHPACQLQGTDNLFLFRTARYRDQPLIVRGPGAGTVVTAAGVLADLLSMQRRRAPTWLRQRRPE